MNKLLPWQQAGWQILTGYIKQQRVPQALLITGAKGLGKIQLAHRFAQTLLCSSRLPEQVFCGHCHSCTLFMAQTHPDFIHVTSEEDAKVIGVNTIRELINRLVLKPQFAGYRLVLIQPAELLNNAAANAFLKCLEEPNARTCIVLITEKPAKLPSTIKSRCQKLKLTVPDKIMATQWLHEQNIHENIEILLSLAQGAPLLACEYAVHENLAYRRQCFAEWTQVAKRKISPVSVAEQWYKQNASVIIFWLIGWVADMIKCCFDPHTTNLYSLDLRNILQQMALRLDLKQLYQFYDLLLNCQQKLDTQINKQLMFEQILISWFNLNHGQSSWQSQK